MRDAASSSFLIDTHLLIWWAIGSPNLPPDARNMLEASYGRLVASVIVFWEIAIKRAKGKLDLDPEKMRSELVARRFDFLPVDLHHVGALGDLPRLHGDPFDRMMIAQAETEGLTFLTADARLGAYGRRVRVV